jgi:hypothetical protein
MKRRPLAYLTASAMLLAAACEDDEGPSSSGGDAPVDSPSPLDALDTKIPDGPTPDGMLPDAGDAGVEDTRVSVDCGAVCNKQALFNIPGYLARFGDEGRTIDVSACLGNVCGSIRAERLGGQNPDISSRMGRTTSVELSADGWLTVWLSGGPPPDAQQEVRLRIATTTGRQLIDYTGNATGQEHCPGGAACVHCQAIVVDIDPADAGQAVDSADPARAGHCGP